MAKKIETLASAEQTKLEQFQRVDAKFWELTRQREAIEKQISDINVEIRSKYRGWPKAGEFVPAAPPSPKPVSQAVKDHIGDVIEVKDPEPLPPPKLAERQALVEKSKGLQQKRQELLDAAGVLLHAKFECCMDASVETADRLAPQGDLHKSRITNALIEFMSATIDYDEWVRSEFNDKKISWLFHRPLPMGEFDSFRFAAARFLEAASEQGFADKSLAKRWREFERLSAPPLTPHHHPRFHVRAR